MKEKATSLFLTVIMLLVVCTSEATSQEFLDDRDAWLAAICGTRIEDDFDNIQGTGLIDLGSPATFAWGEIAVPDGTTGVIAFVDQGDTLIFTNPLEGKLVITPDPSNGPFEGFCIRYSSDDNNTTTIDLLDGTTLVDTLTLPPNPQSAGNGNIFYCWRNDTGENITSFEYTTTTLAGIYASELAFGSCDSKDENPRDQLGSLIDDLEALLPTGSTDDDLAILEALDYLNTMNGDKFWADEDTLLNNGKAFFAKANQAMSSLLLVQSVNVDDQITGLHNLLASVVETAIQDAIDGGGNQSAIDEAINFEAVAQMLEDLGDDLGAVSNRRKAWWSAFRS